MVGYDKLPPLWAYATRLLVALGDEHLVSYTLHPVVPHKDRDTEERPERRRIVTGELPRRCGFLWRSNR